MDGNTDTTAHDHTARIARLAWFCALVLPLILVALLLGVRSAQAEPPEGGEPASTVFEGELELEEEVEGEFAEEECDIAQEEVEEDEITQAEADAFCKEAKAEANFTGEAAGSSSTTAAVCPIHSASAHAAVHNDRLKLTLGYTTNTPVTATIQIHGVGTFKRHLGKSGVLRFSKKPGSEPRGQTVVRIKLPASERAGCPSRRLVLFPR